MKHTTEEASSLSPELHVADNAPIDTATIELLDRWMREDETENPEVLRAREQELADFKRAMNKNRALSGEPPLFP